MKKGLLLLLLLTAWVAYSPYIYAQNSIRLRQERPDRPVKSIEFINSTTRSVVKTFDIQANNPYNKLSYNVRSVKEDGAKVYDLGKVSSRQFMSKNLKQARVNETPDYEVASATSYYQLSNETENSIAVAYELNLHPAEGGVIEDLRQSQLIVLDKAGSKLLTLDLSHDCIGPALAENGKYIGFTYGGEAAHDRNITERGLKIFDIGGNLLVNIKEAGIEGGFVKGQWLIYYKTVSQNVIRFLAFNCESGVLKDKTLNAGDASWSVTSEGISLRSAAGTKRLESFENF